MLERRETCGYGRNLRAWLAVVGAAVSSLAAAGAVQAQELVVDSLISGERQTLTIPELEKLAPLSKTDDVLSVLLGHNEQTSHFLARIRTAELPHVHEKYDISVTLLKGHGAMLMGEDLREVGQGSVFYVPRGTLHAFANESSEPALAYVVFNPRFEEVVPGATLGSEPNLSSEAEQP